MNFLVRPLRHCYPVLLREGRRSCSSKKSSVRVTVCGALGEVGQPLSLLLKQVPEINELCLYDAKRTKAYAMELNLIDTNCNVIGSDGFGKEREVFENSDIVVIVAANPGSACCNYCDMFHANKSVVCRTASVIARHCPKAFVAVVTHPINSLVPLMSEQLRIHGNYDPRKVFGVTTLDCVRATNFTAEVLNLKAEDIDVPAIVGGFGKTIVAVVSGSNPPVTARHEDVEKVVKAVRKAHNKILKAKCCQGPTHSAAYAICQFVTSLAKALRGEPDIVQCSFVRSNIIEDLRYMSTRLLLGPDGVEKNFGLPCMSLYEHNVLVEAVEFLKDDIYIGEMEAGVNYVLCNDRCEDLCNN